MQREEKSERSRRAVLDAALSLFARHGFRGTTMRDIAQRAEVSTGNVYHHFPDKDALFSALIEEYVEIISTPRFPFIRVLADSVRFPDNIEELGFAARDSLRQYHRYVALVYVDVVEFGGSHLRTFYADITRNFAEVFQQNIDPAEVQERLRREISPTAALLLTTRIFFAWHLLDLMFGVNDPRGRTPTEAVQEIADVIRNGICVRPSP